MRSARQDTIRGAIDKIAGRVLEAYGKLTGNRSASAKGKAARGRGASRSAMGRLKRHGRSLQPPGAGVGPEGRGPLDP
jgi:uncharacterized protein YjbJ (UPF0337 family)